MKALYGILGGVAMAALLGTGATAQNAPSLGKVRMASVTEAKLAPQVVRMSGSATPTTAPAPVAGPSLSAAAKMAEDYFNGLNTLQAGFVQTVTGEVKPSEGTFSLKRPKQFVWVYATPFPQKIIGTGSAVYYVDLQRNQVTQLPQNAGLARLFNAKTLNFSQQGLRTTGVKSDSRTMAVTFAVDKKIATSDQAGLVALTIVFDKLAGGQLQLARMDALDTLSVTTRVEFKNVKTNVALPAKMFEFTPGVYNQRN